MRRSGNQFFPSFQRNGTSGMNEWVDPGVYDHDRRRLRNVRILFVDADHAEAIRKDVEAWQPCEPGTLLVFHDVDDWPDLPMAKELLTSGSYHMVELCGTALALPTKIIKQKTARKSGRIVQITIEASARPNRWMLQLGFFVIHGSSVAGDTARLQQSAMGAFGLGDKWYSSPQQRQEWSDYQWIGLI
jgi:hypothetical protein